jgi:hypothetical protein
MRFRTGFIAGLAGGYVLGAQAGRERYEQLRRWFRSVADSPQVHQITEKGKEAAGEAGRKGVGAVSSAVSKVGSSVRDRLGNGHEPDAEIQQIGI